MGLPVKTEEWVDTLLLLVQPQRELQLFIKINNNQNHQKIKAYESPKTKDLKKPHSSRQVGGAESRIWQRGAETPCGAQRQQQRRFHIHVQWIKIGREILAASDPRCRPDHTAQGSSTGKINPHNLWL